MTKELKVYLVLSDNREKATKPVLGIYHKKVDALKRANAYMHNNNKDLIYLRQDYKSLSPQKFYEKYGGSAWIEYAWVEQRKIV